MHRGCLHRFQRETKSLLTSLSEEKDSALKRIDTSMEQHIHLLHRRGTLLKNKVIDIYNEHVSKLESDLEEVTTAMTCIVSLKEFHEKLIAQAQCRDVGRGVADLDDVFENVSRKISPSENHIVFEEKHGLDRFRIAAKDLGRVRNSRPTAPRAEPDGGRDPPTRTNSTTTPCTPQASDSDASPATTSDRTALPGADRSATPTPTTIHTPTPTQPTLDINKNNSSSAPDKPHQCPATRPKSFDVTRRKTKQPRFVTASDARAKQQLEPTVTIIRSNPTAVDTYAKPRPANKMYHHLVYTSYDEEELLRELQISRRNNEDDDVTPSQ